VKRIIALLSVLFWLIAPVMGNIVCQTNSMERLLADQKYLVLEDESGERVYIPNSSCTTESGEERSTADYPHSSNNSCFHCIFNSSSGVTGGKIGSLVLTLPSLENASVVPQELALNPFLALTAARAPPILI